MTQKGQSLLGLFIVIFPLQELDTRFGAHNNKLALCFMYYISNMKN